MELIDFGITCSKYSLETKDWRFLNLALRFWIQRMCSEKFILRQEVDICLNVLKKVLMKIVVVSQTNWSLNLIYLLGGIDVFPSAVVIVKPSQNNITKHLLNEYSESTVNTLKL